MYVCVARNFLTEIEAYGNSSTSGTPPTLVETTNKPQDAAEYRNRIRLARDFSIHTYCKSIAYWTFVSQHSFTEYEYHTCIHANATVQYIT